MNPKKITPKIAVFIAIIMAISILLSSCDTKKNQSERIAFVIGDYIDCLNRRDYERVYDFLSGSAKQSINRYSFEQKHEQFFNHLNINNITSDVSQSSDDPLHSMAYVTFSYESELVGTMENFLVVELIKQDNNWKIDWKPEMLHSEIDWYSSVRSRETTGRRGEIFALGKLVAANAPGISILVNPLEVENESQLISALSPLIGMSEKKISEKLDASILQAQIVVDRLRLRNKPTTDERSEVVLDLGRGEVVNVLDDGEKHMPLPAENAEEDDGWASENTSSPSVAQSNEEDSILGFYRVEFKTDVEIEKEEIEEKKGLFKSISSFFSGDDKSEKDKDTATSDNAELSNTQDAATSDNAELSDLQDAATSDNAELSNIQDTATSDNAELSNTQDAATSDNAELSNLQDTGSLPLLSDVASNIETQGQSDVEIEEVMKHSFTGYVYAPYVRLKYSQDLVLLKSFRADMIEDESLETLSQIPGVVIDKENFSDFRVYPYGESMFHVIGYTGLLVDTRLKAHIEEAEAKGVEPTYDSNSIVGLTGIEAKFQEYLKEKTGREIFIADENGAVKKMLYKQEAADGSDVHLTLDPELQQWSYDLLRLYLTDDQSGAIYTMNPQTGSVSCMVSYPSVDPNRIPYMTSKEWLVINTDEERAPLFNRVLSANYIPGSIFKPFTAVLGLENGKISTETVFPYQEFIENNRWNPAEHGDGSWNWTSPPIKRVENRFGISDFTTSLRESDNIFFAWTAMIIGAEAFTDYFKNKLGFEEPIPFDLPVRPSHFFDPTDIAPDFNIAMLADSGYGQGQLTVTPLHAGTIFSAFANGGDAMAPYVVESINKTEGLSYIREYSAEKEIWKKDIISDEYVLSAVASGLDDVMRIGTGKSVSSPYNLAGKTGTAQIGRGKELSWLVSFKSEGEKDFLASVTIEYVEGEKQSKARFPITSSLFQFEYDKNSIEIEETGAEVIDSIALDNMPQNNAGQGSEGTRQQSQQSNSDEQQAQSFDDGFEPEDVDFGDMAEENDSPDAGANDGLEELGN